MIHFFLFWLVSPTFAGIQFEWTESTSSLVSGNYGMITAHSSTSDYPECIFLLGGTETLTGAYCYNITNNNIIIWDDLQDFYANEVTNNAVMIGNNIFFVGAAGQSNINEYHRIYYYNILSKEKVQIYANYVYESCLIKHPTNEKLFIMYGRRDSNDYNNFYSFSIATQTLTEEVSPIYDRYGQTCAILNNYFYILFGQSIYIERININLLDSFETLSITLNDINDNINGIDWDLSSYAPSIVYDSTIYTIAGAFDASYPIIVRLNQIDSDDNIFNITVGYDSPIGSQKHSAMYVNTLFLLLSAIGVLRSIFLCLSCQ